LPVIQEQKVTRKKSSTNQTFPGILQGRLEWDDPNSIDKKTKRLLKNRESAKECRRKKKEYIVELENRVQTLEKKNIELTKELEDLKKKFLVDKWMNQFQNKNNSMYFT